MFTTAPQDKNAPLITQRAVDQGSYRLAERRRTLALYRARV
jgi:hypothetical protein